MHERLANGGAKQRFWQLHRALGVEAEKLYSAGAVWADIIPNLSAARVQHEIEAREFIETFERDVGTIPDLSDISLYSLWPYAHVKIYRLREPFDINAAPNFGFDRQQIW